MTKAQESVRKDIERFFGVLQGRFRILRNELLEWSDTSIIEILDVCVIIHNLIVKLCESEQIVNEMSTGGRKLNTQDLVSDFVDEQVDKNRVMLY